MMLQHVVLSGNFEKKGDRPLQSWDEPAVKIQSQLVTMTSLFQETSLHFINQPFKCLNRIIAGHRSFCINLNENLGGGADLLESRWTSSACCCQLSSSPPAITIQLEIRWWLVSTATFHGRWGSIQYSGNVQMHSVIFQWCHWQAPHVLKHFPMKRCFSRVTKLSVCECMEYKLRTPFQLVRSQGGLNYVSDTGDWCQQNLVMMCPPILGLFPLTWFWLSLVPHTLLLKFIWKTENFTFFLLHLPWGRGRVTRWGHCHL